MPNTTMIKQHSRRSALAVAVLSLSPAPLVAQSSSSEHQMSAHAGHSMDSTKPPAKAAPMGADPIGLPMTRMGSGTSWLPDSAPMFGVMRSAGSWMVMLHGSAFLQQVVQGGERGDTQFGAVNWGMVNAMRPLAGGRLQLRAMGSLDTYTVGRRGYPLLLQTGESYRGEALHDRQHPHDMLMEIAAVYEHALTTGTAVQLYAAAAGEPALGPVAFPHRPSAAGDPLATLAHHWQDATHVSFGVVTVGVYNRFVKLEGSAFNGREPDDMRTNLDYKGARLDSWAGRITVSPTSELAMSASFGRLADAEKAHPGEAVRRAVGSVLWSRSRGTRTHSIALITGSNKVGDESWSHSAGVEALTDRGGLQFFGRAEMVQKSGEELVLSDAHSTVLMTSARAALPVAATIAMRDPDLSEARYNVAHLTLGAIREVQAGRAGRVGLGVRGTINMLPASLETVYGSRTPLGAAIFLRWRTGRMNMAAMDHGSMSHEH